MLSVSMHAQILDPCLFLTSRAQRMCALNSEGQDDLKSVTELFYPSLVMLSIIWLVGKSDR